MLVALTAENAVDETPLPQLSSPPLTPQLPFELVIVKLSFDPDRVNVASVCVETTPLEISPPIDWPSCSATMVALAGRDPSEVYAAGSQLWYTVSRKGWYRTPVGADCGPERGVILSLYILNS